jgi:hypothetical protein
MGLSFISRPSSRIRPLATLAASFILPELERNMSAERCTTNARCRSKIVKQRKRQFGTLFQSDQVRGARNHDEACVRNLGSYVFPHKLW